MSMTTFSPGRMAISTLALLGTCLGKPHRKAIAFDWQSTVMVSYKRAAAKRDVLSLCSENISPYYLGLDLRFQY